MVKSQAECSQNAYKCFFKPLNTNFSKFFGQIWHFQQQKKKKKKKRPCFFAFYGRSGEGNITIYFFFCLMNSLAMEINCRLKILWKRRESSMDMMIWYNCVLPWWLHVSYSLFMTSCMCNNSVELILLKWESIFWRKYIFHEYLVETFFLKIA